MITKKALSTSFLLGLIVAIVSLIVYLAFIGPLFSNYSYSQTINSCSQYLEFSANKNSLFITEDDKSKISQEYIDSVSSYCSSREIEVSDHSHIEGASSLIYDCWNKASEGKEVLAQTYNGSLCLYCGTIKTKETINNFPEKLINSLSQNKYSNLFSSKTQVTNLNENLLNKEYLTSELNLAFLNEEDNVSIFFMAYRGGNTGNYDRVERRLSTTEIPGISNYISTAYDNPIQTHAQISLFKNQNFEELSQFCDPLIIPNKHYD